MADEKPSGFAARLRSLREAAGFTQSELAERAGLHKLGVAKLEQGLREPAWATVQALARALGVTCGAFEIKAGEEKLPTAAAKKGPGRPCVVIDPETGERSITVTITDADRAGPGCSPEDRRIRGVMIKTPSVEVDDQSATPKKGPGRPKKAAADAGGANVEEQAGDASQAKGGAAKRAKKTKSK